MDRIFRDFQENDKSELFTMIQELYKEDFSGIYITLDKIQRTIEFIRNHPLMGNILLIVEKNTEIVLGYCILINYWSNEYGGNLLHLDELYIRPKYRRQGIARSLIHYLKSSKFNNLVGIQLEISQSNSGAREFYDKLNFKPSSSTIMIFEI
jgi:ribosomal protein S18 acetylase RimI-like enzyme